MAPNDSVITFLSFSINDLPNEEARMEMFLNSLLQQDFRQWSAIIIDGSSPDKRFPMPRDPRITWYQKEIKTDTWRPAEIRNELALQATSDVICHINTDCFYAPNFAETLINNIAANALILCRRKKLLESSWLSPSGLTCDRISNNKISKLKWGSICSIGECQCVMRKTFIDIGGYYQLIQNNQVAKSNEIIAGKEDSNLHSYFTKQNGYQFLQHKLKVNWVTDKTWIAHFEHPPRNNKQQWHNKYGEKAGTFKPQSHKK